jgi:hypothetical protein
MLSFRSFVTLLAAPWMVSAFVQPSFGGAVRSRASLKVRRAVVTREECSLPFLDILLFLPLYSRYY